MEDDEERSEEGQDHLLRIMISTDNHLGYRERDPIRGLDSFAAFEETLLRAKQKECDLVLLGGDLFHDNKPSRRTLHNTLDLLRKHVMSHDPVGFRILSDQRQAFANRWGRVNYEDPFYSVGLPIFSIHGNHDDPTREGGSEALAALDLLAVTNLINYFGKQDKVDEICVKPILMSKGDTKVALYGLGNIRDERLNRMWTKKKVSFMRPSVKDGRENFFNILVLHQNRAEGRGRKNAVWESMIPEWFDIVIWGHEHECQVQFQESLHGHFHIVQPGSTVATSLVDGEAAVKHVALLELRGQQFRNTPIRLRSVRPFATGEVRLDSEEYGLDPEDAKIDKKVDELLEREVKNLVSAAISQRQQLDDEEAEDGADELPDQTYALQEPDQVLVRLKVDRYGFPTLNNQRFGARFVGEVANPSEILLFHQRRRLGEGAEATLAGGKKRARDHALAQPILPDEADDVNVEDLVTKQLETSDKKLRLLKEADLKDALEEYVKKQDANAINELVQQSLEDMQSKLAKNKGVDDKGLIHEAVADSNNRSSGSGSGSKGGNSYGGREEDEEVDEEVDEDDAGADDYKGGARKSKGKGKTGRGSRSGGLAPIFGKETGRTKNKGKRGRNQRNEASDFDSEVEEMEEDEEEEDEEEEEPPRKRAASRRPARNAAQKAVIAVEDEEDEDEDVGGKEYGVGGPEDDDAEPSVEDLVSEDDEEEYHSGDGQEDSDGEDDYTPVKKRGRAAVSKAKPRAAAKAKAKGKGKPAAKLNAAKPAAKPKARISSSRAASQRSATQSQPSASTQRRRAMPGWASQAQSVASQQSRADDDEHEADDW